MHAGAPRRDSYLILAVRIKCNSGFVIDETRRSGEVIVEESDIEWLRIDDSHSKI